MTTLFTNHEQFIAWRNGIPKNCVIGFVPTMGALHQGHISLIERAESECDFVVVSIYVNELQFNSERDYERYPRTEDADFNLCVRANVDAIFAPIKSEIFPEDSVTLLSPSRSAENFEGADRPGHFSGVVTVVDRLFFIVKPTIAYFGLKDYQQVAVITDMTAKLHPHVEIRACSTMRESDGLAMSSRNRFLSPTGRELASQIPLALSGALNQWKTGTTRASELIQWTKQQLGAFPNIELQYISIVRNGTMSQVDTVSETDVLIAAVVIDGIRLIDNMQFSIV